MSLLALCQMKVEAKDPELNAKRAIELMREAAANGACLVAFPEMVTGYMVGDLWEDHSYLTLCERSNRMIEGEARRLGVACLFGGVSRDASCERYDDGRQVRHNSVYMVPQGDSATVLQHKRNLPNYREFDDKRYFAAGAPSTGTLYLDSTSVSITSSVCEDGWDDHYVSHPIAELADVERGRMIHVDSTCRTLRVPHPPHMSVHFNLSCSPFTVGKNKARNRRFAEHSNGFDLLCYVNNVGIQNNGKGVFTFDGTTTVYKDGHVLGALPALKECIGYVEVDPRHNKAFLLGDNWLASQEDPSMSDVLVYGIQEFMGLNNLKRVVIGLSGGIDSALSALLHVKALGSKNVLLVNMPTEHNSRTTKDIAAEIASNLGCPYMVVPVGDLCKVVASSVADGICTFEMNDVTFPFGYKVDSENIAARMRGAGIQAALAAGIGGVFPNNGNKSEASVAYCTIGGDLMGYLAPLGDLWKGEVYTMAKELSDEMGGILPYSIFSLKPSAELSSSQNVDEGKGDPLTYWYHDKLFASWMEPWERSGIEGTIQAYAEGTLLEDLGIADRVQDFRELFPDAKAFVADAERWWALHTGLAIVKRVQAPPVLVLKRRSYGYDYREAIGRQGLGDSYLSLKKALLGEDDA